MKNILLLFILYIASCHLVVGQDNRVSCPPCRPVLGCGQCWENQQQADNACAANFRVNATPSTWEEQNEFNIYPNPNTTGHFFLKNTKPLYGEIMIVNQIGSVVQQFRLDGAKEFEFGDKNTFPSGLYHLRFMDRSGKHRLSKTLLIE